MSAFRSLLGRLRSSPEKAPANLTPAGTLVSDLWLDQPDARRQIEAAERRGQITATEAEGLAGFVENGYLICEIEVPAAVYDDIEGWIPRLWHERPGNVAYAYHSVLKPFTDADESRDRQPSYRIADLHGVSAGALALYLQPQIFRWVELVLGTRPVATQSLYFEYGSQQALHRDPVFVQTQPPSHLVAAWVALEDIDPGSGPLVYVPGSHRLPYFQLAAGEHRFDHQRHGEAEIRAMEAFDREQMARHQLQVQPFTPRRGEVLIWHHSLLHGGSAPTDSRLTRKSFVVHFSSFDTFQRLKQTYLERVPAEAGGVVERRRIVETETRLERAGCAGFASPLAERWARTHASA